MAENLSISGGYQGYFMAQAATDKLTTYEIYNWLNRTLFLAKLKEWNDFLWE